MSFHWIDTADHGYRPLKASGRTAADVLAEVADTHGGVGGGPARLTSTPCDPSASMGLIGNCDGNP